jgi:hypothetical protein
LFLLGGLLFLAGPAIYFVHVRLQILKMPWYVPVLATVGVLCMAVSVRRRRGVWRSCGLALFVVLCGLEWFFTLSVARSPTYAGPAQVGRRLPEFAAACADGTAFTNKDLEDGHRTALVFYRGRW